VKNLGQLLFSKYVIPFELSSVLFLSGMVGAVMIGKKDAEDIN
jgi:NADH-quinone oxidoreductase subunit J